MASITESAATVNATREFTVYGHRSGTVTVQSTLNDAEAAAFCAASDSTFANSLAEQYSRRSLSSLQTAWLHVLADEAHRDAAAAAKGCDVLVRDEMQMDAVVAMLTRAGGKLKSPRIDLIDSDGSRYRLTLNGDRPRHPGSVSVYSLRSGYLGCIATDGLWLPTAAASVHPGLADLLFRFAQDPASAARDFARLTGRCCFCRLDLTDPRSTEVGYGPVCAGHFGLSWGSQAPVDANEVAARRSEAARKAAATRRLKAQAAD